MKLVIFSFLLKERNRKFKAENLWLRISLASLKQINSPPEADQTEFVFTLRSFILFTPNILSL